MLSALVIVMVVALQGPIPSAGETVQGPHSQTESQSAQTQSSPPPTIAAPAQVQSLPTQTDNPRQQPGPQGDGATFYWWREGPNIGLFVVTVVLAFVAIIQWHTHVVMHRSSQAVERAYIALSHIPPGLVVHTVRVDDTTWNHGVSLRLKVTNTGNTPAEITSTLVQVIWTNADIPNRPNYNKTLVRNGRVLLNKGGSYGITHRYLFHTTRKPSFHEAFREMSMAGHTLYVIAYADYIDKFGARHRSGYARVYEPLLDDKSLPDYLEPVPSKEASSAAERAIRSGFQRFSQKRYERRSNLIFITRTGYNYDRRRSYPDGEDWDDKTRWPVLDTVVYYLAAMSSRVVAYIDAFGGPTLANHIRSTSEPKPRP